MYLAELDCHCGGTCGACSSGLAGIFDDVGTTLDITASTLPNMGPGSGVTNAAFTGLEAALDYVPVVGPIASDAVAIFQTAFGMIGRGRHEADEITPTQNNLMAYLGRITNQLIAHPGPNVQQLQAYLYLVINAAKVFKQFVENPRFTDGRASAGALNTVMPYIDGSSGYHWPPPMHSDGIGGSVTWGDGTPGGPGTDGMVGAIQRAIVNLGGYPVPVPMVTQGPTGIPTLQSNYPNTTLPQIPQAGIVNSWPPVANPPQGLAYSLGGLDTSTLLPIAAVGAWLLVMSRR
jgi:hypothetical protein